MSVWVTALRYGLDWFSAHKKYMYPNNGNHADGASQINKTSIMTLPNLISPPNPTNECLRVIVRCLLEYLNNQ